MKLKNGKKKHFLLSPFERSTHVRTIYFFYSFSEKISERVRSAIMTRKAYLPAYLFYRFA